MNRERYVSLVAGRSGIGPTDSLRAEVPDMVNAAIFAFTTRHQAGWDWLHRTITLPMVADTLVYTFDDIEALLDLNVALAADATPFPLVRVRHVTLVSGESRSPFPRVARLELDRHCDHGWNAEGREFRVWPTPDGTETLELRVLIGERPLEADDESPLLPDLYSEAIVHMGRSIAYERKQDDERSMAARKQADAEIMRAIAWSGAMDGAQRMPSVVD